MFKQPLKYELVYTKLIDISRGSIRGTDLRNRLDYYFGGRSLFLYEVKRRLVEIWRYYGQ